MDILTATVRGRRPLSAHLVTIELEVDGDMPSTGIADEYVRLLIAPQGRPLVLPQITDDWQVVQPEGTEPPVSRVYTISDHRVVDGRVRIDLDIALHDAGPGSDWARGCEPGDAVGLIAPHGLYAARDSVTHQLLVADITGLPALARILRDLEPGQQVSAVVVLTDEGDRIPLPSPADVDLQWIVVDDVPDIAVALESAVLEAPLLESDVPTGQRYVWFAGEARASRGVRKHLRRVLGWPQTDFYTCGYWQFDKEAWEARYAEVQAAVEAEARRAYAELAERDQGAYLDRIDEIYEASGL